MTNLKSLTKDELVQQLSRAIALLDKQQKQHTAFKAKYSTLIELFENNKNGVFTVSNWIEDELLVKSWKAKKEISISNKTHQWFYGLLENAINLIKSKEYFTVIVDKDIKIGNAQGSPYTISVDWDKVSNAKKNYLNSEFDLDIPTNKQDDRLIRDEVAEELSQFMYSLTGKSIEY